MIRVLSAALFLCIGSVVSAEIIVPLKTIPVRSIVAIEDLTTVSKTIAGAVTDADEIIGLEARVVLYPGRPIRRGDVGPPALINRNDLVTLIYTRGSLRIATEGRALDRGALGENVRAMNVSSHMTVSGTITAEGSIEVQQ